MPRMGKVDAERLVEFGRRVILESGGVPSRAKHLLEEFEIGSSTARGWFADYREQHSDDFYDTCVTAGRADIEVLQTNVRLAKQKQKLQDVQRVERKAFRESVREENVVEEYLTALIEALNLKVADWGAPPEVVHRESAGVGCVHLSDLHFNERVDLPQNKYDFDIAGDRIAMHVRKAAALFKSQGLSKVCLALTADLMNSDRRLDELLANADNRARAVVGAVDILSQAVRDLRSRGFTVTISWINGNESRLGKDRGWTSKLASDSYDETIGLMLEHIFTVAAPDPGVEVIPPIDPSETIINLAGQNVLLFHGDSRLKSNLSDALQTITGKYARRGITVDFAIFGHIHEAFISDTFARSGSTVGDNAYSDKALNISGRASQNAHIFWENGNRDSVKFDLQNTTGDGYRTSIEYQKYHSKSEDLTRQRVTIFEVKV